MAEHFAERREGARDDSDTALDGAPEDDKPDAICQGLMVASAEAQTCGAWCSDLQRILSSLV